MALIFLPFPGPHRADLHLLPALRPVTAMLRNGFGTLGPTESTIVIAELFITGLLILRLAVHLFRYGSIQYSGKLSIAGTFRKRTPPAGK